MSRTVQVAVMLVAAILEVGGDALIRSGMRGRGWVLIALGCAILAAYGVVLNLLPVDFSKLLGAYVAFFALASVAFGRFVFGEQVAASTWTGVAVVLLGSLIIQYGGR
jgi:small multidrug resistance family-3 protein